MEFRQNNCRHSPGIPPDSIQELCQNYCQHSAGFHRIPPWNSAGIIAGIPLVFRRIPSWNSTGVIATASSYETQSTQTFELGNNLL